MSDTQVIGATADSPEVKLVAGFFKGAKIVADGRATPTDADPIQLSRAGVAAALVSIPLRYMHTPSEIVAVDDLDQTVELLAHAIAAMKPGQKWIPF